MAARYGRGYEELGRDEGAPVQFKVISLFSGALGLDLGLEHTGRYRLLACAEKIPAFCATIRANRDAGRIGSPDTRVYEGDIRNLDPHAVMKELGIRPGELDLLVGGPPCQSFSTTGKRRTVQDPRGTLLWDFLRFIEAVKPKFFLMENVRGLMSAALKHRPISERPDKGGAPLEPDELPGSVVKAFLEDLNGSYRLDCFEVNAANYGVPQIRERTIFIGNRFNRLVDFPEPTHGMETRESAPTLFDGPLPNIKPFRTLGDAIGGLSDPTREIMDFSPRKKRILSMIPPGGNWRCLPEDVAREFMGRAFDAKGGRSGWWRRLTLNLPCPTIVTMPNHAGTALCHPTEVRALSLRECARVQEFPDEWEFHGTTSEKYAQVGNAVPVRLGTVCGTVLAKHLDELTDSGTIRSRLKHPPFRIVYLKSHIRTRRWYKAGKELVWDGKAVNRGAEYGAAKTGRRVTNDPIKG